MVEPLDEMNSVSLKKNKDDSFQVAPSRFVFKRAFYFGGKRDC